MNCVRGGAAAPNMHNCRKNYRKSIDNCVPVLYNEQAAKREHSSAGRALALQARGHRFEPCCSHQSGPVVQLVRTLACHARGRRFEPVPGRHFFLLNASIAQLVEQGTENPCVTGSIPVRGTNKKSPISRAFLYL